MIELKILSGPILRGEYEKVKQALETELPKDVSFLFEDEAYCNIQSREALKTFKLILDHPQFVFDDLFIARQLYFSAPKSQELVIKHPKFLKVVRARQYFTEYFYERFGAHANYTEVGMLQRYIQVENAILSRKKADRIRLAFALYPALVNYIRKFKEQYYAPGGQGYWNAKARFEKEIFA